MNCRFAGRQRDRSRVRLHEPRLLTHGYRRRFGIPPLRDRIEGRIPFQFRSFPAHALRPRGVS